MWPFTLSSRLLIVVLVGRYPAYYLMGRDPIPLRLGFPDPCRSRGGSIRY